MMINLIHEFLGTMLGVMAGSVVLTALLMNKRVLKWYLKNITKLSNEVAAEMFIEGDLEETEE